MSVLVVSPNVAAAEPQQPSPRAETATAVEGGIFARQLHEATRKTTMTMGEARGALASAWRSTFGTPPPRDTLAILVGQWGVETGRGSSMPGFNFGGIKGTGPSGLSLVSRTTEGAGAQAHRTTDRFRAYRSADEGALDYVHLLRDRFPAAIDRARAGDAPGFVHALKHAGYFTADEGQYTRALGAVARDAGYRGPLGPAAPADPLPIAPAMPETDSDGIPSLTGLEAISFEHALDASALRIVGAGEPRGQS